MAHRNFARGSMPPPHSYEWAGVAKPPGQTTSGRAPARPAAAQAAPRPRPAPPPQEQGTPVSILAVSETIVLKKKRNWLGYGIAGAIGFLLGHETCRRRP